MTIHSVVIQKLLSTNAHLGRRAAEHHFKIYSCGTRNGLTVIDSDKTLICIRNACNFIGNLFRAKGRFLFVNTNPLCDEIIEQMIKTIGVKNDTSWRLGGFLTNSLSPKRFRGRNKKFNLTAIQAPDCVVIFDTERKSSVILEANRLQIPVVGLVDPTMPWATYKRIAYPVPANDSVQFVYLFCNLITKTILHEQKKLKAGASKRSTESKAESREDALQIDSASKKGKIFVLPYDSLQPAPEDISETKQLLEKVVVLKLNGCSGTMMGFNGPKSTIEVHDGMTCLDLIINQIESLNLKYGCNIPLLLANSINTHDSTLKVLQRQTNKNIHTFLQGQQQEWDAAEAVPQESAAVSQRGMYPANLSEVFSSLETSEKLELLLSQGKEYIIVLNSDNLADLVDFKILNHFIQQSIDSCIEVVPASSDLEGDFSSLQGKFEPKEKLKFTNIMWININSILRLMQISSLSISKLFDEAFAINVPESRYYPVESTSDLLLFQSDLYTFVDGIPTRNAARKNPADPSIELGPEFANVNDFHRRFKSKPSIIDLDRLKVTGNVWFGTGVTLKGKVSILSRPDVKIVIPDGMVLENKIITRPSDFGGPSLAL